MGFSACLPWSSHQSYWDEFSLKGLKVKAKPPKKEAFQGSVAGIPPYFWSKGLRNRVENRLARLLRRKPKKNHPVHTGYAEARNLMGAGAVADLDKLSLQALEFVTDVFADLDDNNDDETSSWGEKTKLSSSSLSSPDFGPRTVQLRLSPELERWKQDQHAAGNILPAKGRGLTQASDECVRLIGAADWPEALKTNNALFGCGIAALLMGAANPPTMFSNYVTDMAFYYEHGYNYVFPSLEELVQRGIADPFALRTVGGQERRDCVRIGKRYIQGKIALEDKHKQHLTNRAARMDRRTAQIVSLSESSLLGMAAEAVARGFDAGSVMADLVWSSPGTDVVDVGCDIVNSEVMNSLLNVTDVTDTGLVSEDVLRRVYDAYAACGARMLTQRWHEPVARMCAALYTWHIQNDRHMFIRRALLGWSKARKATPASPPCEADFDEAFDKQFRLTGFSRPLDPEYVCSGEDTCDHVHQLLERNGHEPLLRELWDFLVVRVLNYVRGGKVDEECEKNLVEGSRRRMAELFSKGQVLEMAWMIAHANHHAWQVNYLFEAAMFGSILDSGSLAGKLDRAEES